MDDFCWECDGPLDEEGNCLGCYYDEQFTEDLDD